jgi:hypothetical protein
MTDFDKVRRSPEVAPESDSQPFYPRNEGGGTRRTSGAWSQTEEYQDKSVEMRLWDNVVVDIES